MLRNINLYHIHNYNHLHKSAYINLEYAYLLPLSTLTQHSQVTPSVQKISLWTNPTPELDQTLCLHVLHFSTFSVDDLHALLIAGPADHNWMI